MTRHIPSLFLLLLFVVFVGCGPGNDAHNSGIGRAYSFTEFTLANSAGESFSLNNDELELLEKVWNNDQISDEIDICNTLGDNGAQLEYAYVLDDGFTMKYDASFGTVNGKKYLDIQLLGNGGGFSGDVYWELVAADNVFSINRIVELENTLIDQ